VNNQPNGHMNGAVPHQDPRVVLDQYVGTVLSAAIRGILVSLPQVPPAEVLFAISRITGSILAEGVAGDLATVLKLRTEMKEQFTKAVSNAKIAPGPPLDPSQPPVKM
jgi:hypothetical protein